MKKFFLLALLWPLPAWAVPTTNAYVVATCGTIPTPPGPWVATGSGLNGGPVTVDIHGNLCTNGTFTGTVTANTTAHATAAAPSYGEGTDDALSMTLAGGLREVLVAALPAGTNVIGHVITDSGSVAAVTNTGTFAVQAAQTGTWTVTGAGGTFPVTGTFWQATQPVSVASGQIASGAVSSGAVASGAVASGAFASGALASGAISDGADVTQGAKADPKSTSTDTTAITVMQVMKEISFMEQNPASQAVTNAGTFAVQNAPVVATTGGVTSKVIEPTASDNHAVIKNGAGQVYWITAFNNSAAINYLRLYNAGTGFNGCNSATNLLWEGHIPASTSDAGFVTDLSMPLAFATGISICVTGAYGQTDTTNATASAISVTIGYN